MTVAQYISQSNISSVVAVTAAILLIGCNNASSDPAISSEETTYQPQNRASTSLNVVSPDWGIAATLAAMGQAPIATGDIRVWDQWVGRPELPAATNDLGIRYLPNAELVAQLPVDLLLDNYFYEHSRSLYGKDVAQDSVLFASEDATATWADYTRPTRKLGQLIDQPKLAEEYISDSLIEVKQASSQLNSRYPNVKKFAVVQFVDANNMRMYASNSLFHATFTQMDRQLVTLGEGNEWGFISLQMGDLTRLDPDVCLLVIEPLNPITEHQLADSLVWQRLGYGATSSDNSNNDSRCMAKLPPVWIYGGMASLTNLANNLAAANLVGGAAL